MKNKITYFWNLARLAYFRYLTVRNTAVRTIQGNRMHLRVRSNDISTALFLYGVREELETEIYKEEVLPNMHVVDIGANIGYYTLMAASLVGPKGRVSAIEPFPENFEILKKNVELNAYNDRVKCDNLAIAAESGAGRLYLGEKHNLHSLLPLRSSNDSQAWIDVRLSTLDDYFTEDDSIDLVRMDIEGAECEVLSGMSKVLSERKPKLLIELHPMGTENPDPRLHDALNGLLDFGYMARYLVSSTHPTAVETFIKAGYTPRRFSPFGNARFDDVSAPDLLRFAASRPKITRSVLFV